MFSQLKNSQSHLISSDSWDVIKTIHFCWSFAIISSFTDNSRHSDHRLILFQFVLAWNWLILTWQATAVAWKTIKFERGIERRSNENHCTKLLYNFAKKKKNAYPSLAARYFQCITFNESAMNWNINASTEGKLFLWFNIGRLCVFICFTCVEKREQSLVYFSPFHQRNQGVRGRKAFAA